MNAFIAWAALITLLVVAWLLVPLLRSPRSSSVSSQALNIAIHRDQLKALEADLARGVISQQDFETTRDELQLRLLDDTHQPADAPMSTPPAGTRWSNRYTALTVGVSTPLLAVALYLQLGNPAAIHAGKSAQVTEQDVRKMIDDMAERQRASPDNLRGWAVLGRSYKMTGRLQEARDAFEKAGIAYLETDPDALLDYAALLGNLAGNRLEGKPAELIATVLKLNPNHPGGLMLSGISAYQRADYAGAVTQWEKLLGMMDPNSMEAQQMQANIADARSQGKLPPPDVSKLPPVPAAAAGGMTPEMINQMVERLANRLKDNPDDHAGWARLANAYKVQGRLDDAVAAYAKTGPLLKTDADLLTQYADVLAMRAKGNLAGEPLQLINQALAIQPRHPMALMMAGQAAYAQADYARAISHWENVLDVLPPQSRDHQQVQAEIADARAKLAAGRTK